jgi:hypothetical protein
MIKISQDLMDMIQEYDREALHQGVEEGMFSFEDVSLYAVFYDGENHKHTMQEMNELGLFLYDMGRAMGFVVGNSTDPYICKEASGE